jgi:hypothetical protein
MRRPRAGSNVEPAPGWLRGPGLPALGPVCEELARCMAAIGVMLEARPGVGGCLRVSVRTPPMVRREVSRVA